MTKTTPLTKTFKITAGAAAAAASAPALAAMPLASGWALATPWALVAVPAVYVLWKLMKSLPPQPQVTDFAPIRLLFNLQTEDNQPAQMPLWQRIMRASAASLAILGLAHPLQPSDIAIDGEGPVMLVVDNDWSAAGNWALRVDKMNVLIDRAEKQSRSVLILPTAAPADGTPVTVTSLLNAGEARRIAASLQPQAWPADRGSALAALNSLKTIRPASIVWLSNGLDDDKAQTFLQALQETGKLTILEDRPDTQAHLLLPPDAGDAKMAARVRRAHSEKPNIVAVKAYDSANNPLGEAQAEFKPGETEAAAVFDMPPAMRNQLARLSLAGEATAGGVVLLDERWRHRPVGVITDGKIQRGQSLLSESEYIERALQPYVSLSAGPLDALLKRSQAVLILTDAATLSDAAHKQLENWVSDGGTLLRFAGPNLAGREVMRDTLLPVDLRSGSRAPGGTLADGKAAKILPFNEKSPFRGLSIPEGVTIDREVYAMPGPGLDDHIWARLEGGSALVTAKPLGKGTVVLVHTTANLDWTNLPLKGGALFIDMMRKIVAGSQGVNGVTGADGAILQPPIKILNGHGQLSAASAFVRPLTREAIDANAVGPRNPPGFYGNESVRTAHNLAAAVPELKALPAAADNVTRGIYERDKAERDWLSGGLLAAALGLLFADLLVLRGQQKTPAAGERNDAPVPEMK